MENNIKLIAQVLANFNGNLAQHQEIQRAWGEIVKELGVSKGIAKKDGPKDTGSKA